MFNEGPAGLVIALPMTTRLRSIPSWVEVHPQEGGVRQPSAILCEAIRSISTDRRVRSPYLGSRDRLLGDPETIGEFTLGEAGIGPFQT